MSTDHQRGVEAVAAKIRSPSTFPGETATKVAEELIAAYIEAGGFDSVHAPVETELPAVKVKALEWEKPNPFVWDAADIYRIEDNGPIIHNRYWLRILNNRTKHSSLGEAKAAAQADYERRIRSALVPSTPAESRCEELVKALKQCQSVLAMFIDPDTIMETTVLNAYALATAAEAKARAALASYRNASDDLKEAEGVVE